MDPRSRIKLIQLLQEISEYQSSEDSRLRNMYSTMAVWSVYYIVLFVVFRKTLIESPEYLLLLAPSVMIYFWHRFRRTMEERYKLLAAAVLEIGAPPVSEHETVPLPIRPARRTPANKRTAVRKKR